MKSSEDIVSGATCSIISVASGKAIDVEAGSTEDGANVLEWESNDQDNQKWSFEQ